MSTIIRACRRWWIADPATHGAALAYYAIFSIAPVFIIFVALFGSIVGTQAVAGRFLLALEGFAGNQAFKLFETLVAYVSDPANSITATVISSVFIVIGALALFSQVQYALDAIWHGYEYHSKARTFTKTKVLAVLMIVVLGVFLMTSFIVSALIPLITHVNWPASLGALRQVFYIINSIASAVSIIYVVLLFTLMYKYVPRLPVSWRAAFAGGLVGGILFFIGRTLLGLYITANSIFSVYGTAGAVILILVWFYYSALIFFFGGALTYAIDESK